MDKLVISCSKMQIPTHYSHVCLTKSLGIKTNSLVQSHHQFLIQILTPFNRLPKVSE